MPYFVIEQHDMDCDVSELTKEEFLEKVRDEQYHDGFMDDVGEGNPAYWGDKVLVIKGEIVTPQPKTIVKDWEVK